MTKYLKFLLLLLIVFCFTSYLYENWTKIDEFKYETNWFYLSTSVLSLLATLFILPVSLRNIVGLFKYDISLKKISIILFYSQFAKYLPGGIWGYVGRVYLYKKEGMNALDASKSVFLETLLVLLSGGFVSLFFLCFSDSHLLVEYIGGKYLQPVGIGVFAILLITMHPKILNYFMGFIPDRFKKGELWFDYKYLHLIKPLSYLVVFWLGMGVSFWLLIKSFIHIEPGLLPITTSAFVLSWIIGMLVFFTPSGLGAREVSLIVLLNICLPAYMSAFIAVASRIWWVVGEMIWFMLSYVWNRTGDDSDKIILQED